MIALVGLLVACGESGQSEIGQALTSAGGASGEIAGASGAAGQAGAAAGSGGSAGDPDDAGNRFSSGAWRGYFWTSTQGVGTTITPADFTAQTSGMPRCVQGSVAITPDYSGIAMLGVNLSEDGDGKKAVTPSGKGVLIEVQNNAGSPLQFQIEGAAGRWCVYLNESGGFIPWSDFNTACWDNSGKAYDKEPITSAAIVVPGRTTETVAFDFCLTRLAEANGK